jgi:hypothetical protein
MKCRANTHKWRSTCVKPANQIIWLWVCSECNAFVIGEPDLEKTELEKLRESFGVMETCEEQIVRRIMQS